LGFGAGGHRSDEVDRQGRHLLVQLLQDFISHIERLVEKHEISPLKHQVSLSLFGNVSDDLKHLLLNFLNRIAIRLLKSLAFSLNIPFKIIDLLLKIATLLVQ